ncbi:MAG: hypothetical protein KME21_29185 [Desmonostoc vinosum HA7617-LM4]|nr:hypothetical protein [Desmonostoc vinosum HA7617-LM4]
MKYRLEKIFYFSALTKGAARSPLLYLSCSPLPLSASSALQELDQGFYSRN